MDRRNFLKTGSLGLGGLMLGGSQLPGLISEANAMSMATGMPWKFGVMADTQWGNRTTDPANPATCAIAIINALNARFIAHGVKFVVQVGDLVDKEVWDCPDTYTNDPFGNAGKKAIRTLPYRAWAVQDLYDAGIGYFPVRGNHEATRIAAQEIPQLSQFH